jgi:hypothetical protein
MKPCVALICIFATAMASGVVITDWSGPATVSGPMDQGDSEKALPTLRKPTGKSSLAERCKSYLKQGPPEHMKDYVPGSMTEVIIAHGAREQ